MGVVQVPLAVFFEIGLVPAAALKTETRCRNQAAQCGRTALGAMAQWLIAHALEFLQFVVTVNASIFVNGHGITPVKTVQV